MDKDIFAEVRRIEGEAERILAEARTERDDILKEAEAEAEAYREQSARKLEADQAHLHEQHERTLFNERAGIEKDFETRRDRLNRTAEHRIHELADWTADRFLEQSR